MLRVSGEGESREIADGWVASRRRCCSRWIRSRNQSRLSVIVYVERAGQKKNATNIHTRAYMRARARARNKAVCFAKCYEFRVRKMNKTYRRALVERDGIPRTSCSGGKMYDERASKSHIDFAGDIHVSRARKPGDKFFLLETLICDIRSLMRTSRENLFVARRWKFRNFIQ